MPKHRDAHVVLREKTFSGLELPFQLRRADPKELANIKTIYPYFIVLDKAPQKEINAILKVFSEKKYLEVRRRTFELYRGGMLYIINNLSGHLPAIEDFIGEQIFIREFKAQLHRYLNLHRIIWEEIAAVKEQGSIRGSEVGAFKARVESYAKTINLIEARINQMGTYLATRGEIAKSDHNLREFLEVLDFKHETLADTLAYIKEIWGMTKNYVATALDLFGASRRKVRKAQ